MVSIEEGLSLRMSILKTHSASTHRIIEVHSFKWPRRPTSIAPTSYLGEDRFGHWLGVRRDDPWWTADRAQGGVFAQPLVKLVPNGTFWSACFHPIDPIVDVDIIHPVSWIGDVLEEIDLELDILRSADGEVWVRDQDKFAQVRRTWQMPDKLAVQAEATCEQVRLLVEQAREPFGSVGHSWLSRFLDDVDDRE